MNSLIIDDQNLWNNFVKNYAPLSGGFLHSWAWSESIKNRGHKIYRLGLYDNGLVGIALLVENPAAHKKYFYIPRGPVLKDNSTLAEAIKTIADFSAKEGAIFLRFEPAILAKDFGPPLALASCARSDCKSQGGDNWILARHLQPENTLLLTLKKSEDELKAAMHEKTRYNIGLAERKGVVIKNYDAKQAMSPKGAETAPLQIFMRLLDETVTRDKIKMYGREYFESILNSTNDNFGAKLWIAYYSPPMPASFPSERGIEGRGGVGVPLAAAFNVYFNQTATYLFGASSDEHRNLMAPHLLQWKMILDAKDKGYKYYDFWGINPKDEKSPNYYPRWEGFSRFKRGFVEKAGTSLELLYAPCLELPISKFWYKVFKFVKKII